MVGVVEKIAEVNGSHDLSALCFNYLAVLDSLTQCGTVTSQEGVNLARKVPRFTQARFVAG